MNFEEALRIELEWVNDLEKKVFPLVAPQKIEAPFCVYRKGNIKFKKTLSGIFPASEKIYELTLATKSYMQLQQLSQVTVDKIISFLGRKIGDSETGPYIANLSIEIIGDQYEPEAEFYTETIQISVNY